MQNETKFTRRQVLGALAAGTLHAATPERPNILYIFTDDHSYRTLSFYKGSIRVGKDAKLRQTNQARRALSRGLQWRLVHAVPLDNAHRPPLIRH